MNKSSLAFQSTQGDFNQNSFSSKMLLQKNECSLIGYILNERKITGWIGSRIIEHFHYINFFLVCLQPLGMERRIIDDAQITYSTTFNAATHSGKEARLNNNRCWCSAATAQFNQWLKVDLRKTLQITGIAIQGDPSYSANYIAKFKLRYSTNGNIYLFTRDVLGADKVCSVR